MNKKGLKTKDAYQLERFKTIKSKKNMQARSLAVRGKGMMTPAFLITSGNDEWGQRVGFLQE